MIYGESEDDGRPHEQKRRERHVAAMRAHHRRKAVQQDSRNARDAEVALPVHDLMGACSDDREPLDDGGREASRLGERKVLAAGPVEGEESLRVELALREPDRLLELGP